MPPEDPNTFQAALDALSADAVLWDGVGDSLGWCARVTSGLALDPKAFTFLGADTAATYEQARALAQAVLLQGALITTGAAHTLRAVRETYESADEAAKARLEGEWTWE